MTRYVGSAIVVAAAVLLSGCGGSSQPNPTAKFKARFVPAVNQLRDTSQAIGTAIGHAPSETDAQIATAYRGFAGRWQNSLSQLEAIKPPAKFAVDFNTLTSAAGRAETDLNGIVSAAVTHSRSAATQAAASLVTDILSAKTASAKITDQLGVK
jgi:type IV pilus biogenesis protein CpaD/CtpE